MFFVSIIFYTIMGCVKIGYLSGAFGSPSNALSGPLEVYVRDDGIYSYIPLALKLYCCYPFNLQISVNSMLLFA